MTALFAIAGFALVIVAGVAFGLWFGGPLLGIALGSAAGGGVSLHLARVNEPLPRRPEAS